MAELGDVEPSAVFSDYLAAAAELIRRQRKRGLVVLITNCRDEDSAELAAGLAPAALAAPGGGRQSARADRRQIAAQPLSRPRVRVRSGRGARSTSRGAATCCSALAAGGAVLIDCEPRALGVELVKRYTVLKRTGAI